MKSVSTIAKLSNDPVALVSEVVRKVNEGNNFDERIPEPTATNIREVGQAVLSYQPTQNAFIDVLVNRIGRVWIEYHMFTNRFRVLKKGMLEYGDTVEQVFVNIAKAHQYDPAVAESQWMKREIPDVNVAFHKLNYQVYYKQTISDDQLRAAFMSWAQMGDFINGIFNAMYTGAEYDEYLTMKKLIGEQIQNGRTGIVVVPEATNSDTAHEVLTKIMATSNNFEFLSGKYNPLGVLTSTPKEKQVLLIKGDAAAYTDVQGYATLFNLEPARAQYRRIIVDDFGPGLEDVQAVLMDENFYMVFDCLQKFTRDMNGEGLYWNYWAHYWRVMSISPFANVVAFVTQAPTVTGVTVTPNTQVIAPGSKGTFKADVTGTGLYPTTVNWSITGNSDAATAINGEGVLTMGATETGPVTVTATSTFNSAVSGTATATATAGRNPT